MRTILAIAMVLANAPLALALVAQPTPGPVIGAVAGPWGLAAAAVGYGAYRAYKALR